MNHITTARTRLDAATGLPAILDAAYDAFEAILAVLRHHEERAGHAFPAFVLAAGAAANGRDWAGDATSLPPATSPFAAHDGAGGLMTGQPWQHVAAEATALSQILAARLTAAADTAATTTDRNCCQQAAGFARQIAALLGGTGLP